MANTEVTKRQPRSGTRQNNARYLKSGTRYNIQLLDLAVTTTSYRTAFSVEDLTRAQTICDRLNEIFKNSRADLDFITPGYANGCYVVLWSGTTWLGKDVFTQETEVGNTYEDLYRGCKLPWYDESGAHYYKYRNGSPTIIATVTDTDVTYNKKSAWEIAFDWANSIRSVVNGWNCSEDATFPLIFEGKIYKLQPLTGSYDSSRSVSATYYGAGEMQPSARTANNDIFHTLDLTVAIPKGNAPGLELNTWVKVTYGKISVVARVADTCGTTKLDLSTGLANALGFKDGTVTISKP